MKHGSCGVLRGFTTAVAHVRSSRRCRGTRERRADLGRTSCRDPWPWRARESLAKCAPAAPDRHGKPHSEDAGRGLREARGRALGAAGAGRGPGLCEAGSPARRQARRGRGRRRGGVRAPWLRGRLFSVHLKGRVSGAASGESVV